MANLIMYQSHRDRRELKKMTGDRLPGRRRTTPAVQVHNLSQQTIGGGSRPHSSRRWSYRDHMGMVVGAGIINGGGGGG